MKRFFTLNYHLYVSVCMYYVHSLFFFFFSFHERGFPIADDITNFALRWEKTNEIYVDFVYVYARLRAILFDVVYTYVCILSFEIMHFRLFKREKFSNKYLTLLRQREFNFAFENNYYYFQVVLLKCSKISP